MCGRYALPRWTLESVEREFDAEWRAAPELHPRYNIAPTQHAPVVRLDGKRRVLDRLRWGLIPSWAKDATIGNRLINARSETAAEKPAFRGAYRRRRCVVPAGGFYEWQSTPAGKIPHWIHGGGERTLAFAGLWESWWPVAGVEVEAIETFTILTTTANGFMRSLHDRMPVILDEDERHAWLDPDASPEALGALLKPAGEGLLVAHAVDKRVGSPHEDDSDLIRPAEARELVLELPLT